MLENIFDSTTQHVLEMIAPLAVVFIVYEIGRLIWFLMKLILKKYPVFMRNLGRLYRALFIKKRIK